jgi:hypothetical protein
LYRGQKIPFTGQCRPQKNVESVLFFGKHIYDHTVAETNRYAAYYTQSTVLKPRSHMRSWQPVTSDEIYVVLRLMMLMGIVQKSALKSYFSRDAVLETPIFPQTIIHHRFELTMKFLHSVDNNTLDTHTGIKKFLKFNPSWKC